MAILRNNKRNYTNISNQILRDKKLSLKAKGLLITMLSLPKTWDYSVSGLAKVCNEGETSIKSGLKELQESKYLIVSKCMPNQTKSGRIEYIYDLYEEPQIEKQEVGKQEVEILPLEILPLEIQEVEIQALENRRQYNTKESITKELNTNNISTTTDTTSDNLKNIFEIIEENFGRTLAPIEYETIQSWSEYNFPLDLLKYAVSKAILNGAYNLSYIDKILYEWDKNNIRTLVQAQKADKDYENKKQNKISSKQDYKHHKTQREREEEAIAKFLSEPDD